MVHYYRMTKKLSKNNKTANNKINNKINKYRSKVKKYCTLKNIEGGFKFRLGDRFKTVFGDTGTILREAEQDEFGIDLPTWVSPYYVVQFDEGNTKPYNGVINKMINGQYVYIAAETNLIQVNEYNLSYNINSPIIPSWIMNDVSNGSNLLFDFIRRNTNSMSNDTKNQLSYIANVFIEQEMKYKDEIDELKHKNKKQKRKIKELEEKKIK